MINDRQTIRLTEEQLNQLVESTVEQLLIQEGWFDSFKGGAKALGNMIGGGAKQAGGSFVNGARQFGNAAAGKVNQYGQSAVNGMRNFANGARQFGNAAAGKVNQYGQAAADKIGNAVQGAQQFGQNVGNTIKAGAMNQNVQSAKQKAIEALDNFMEVSRQTPSGLNDNTLMAIKQAKAALTRAGGVAKGRYTKAYNQTMGGR